MSIQNDTLFSEINRLQHERSTTYEELTDYTNLARNFINNSPILNTVEPDYKFPDLYPEKHDNIVNHEIGSSTLLNRLKKRTITLLLNIYDTLLLNIYDPVNNKVWKIRNKIFPPSNLNQNLRPPIYKAHEDTQGGDTSSVTSEEPNGTFATKENLEAAVEKSINNNIKYILEEAKKALKDTPPIKTTSSWEEILRENIPEENGNANSIVSISIENLVRKIPGNENSKIISHTSTWAFKEEVSRQELTRVYQINISPSLFGSPQSELGFLSIHFDTSNNSLNILNMGFISKTDPSYIQLQELKEKFSKLPNSSTLDAAAALDYAMNPGKREEIEESFKKDFPRSIESKLIIQDEKETTDSESTRSNSGLDSTDQLLKSKFNDPKLITLLKQLICQAAGLEETRFSIESLEDFTTLSLEKVVLTKISDEKITVCRNYNIYSISVRDNHPSISTTSPLAFIGKMKFLYTIEKANGDYKLSLTASPSQEVL